MNIGWKVIGIIALIFVSGCTLSQPAVQPVAYASQEVCHYQDANVTIDGCSAVHQYQNQIEKMQDDAHRFDMTNCFVLSDAPFREGERVNVQIKCEPERW